MANVNYDRLSKLPALQGLSQDEMTAFFRIATKHAVKPGDTVIRTGDKADCFFLIATGNLEILLPQKGQPPVSLAQLGPGQLVGEMPLLYAQPIRQADVVANSDAVLLRFSYADYEGLANSHPEIGKKFRSNLGKIVAGRVWSTLPTEPAAGSAKKIEEPKVNKPAQTTNHEAMTKATIFNGLTDEELQALEAIAIPLSAQPGQPIVRMGEPADSFYLVTNGYCEVQIPKDGQAMPVARLGSGQVFGEMALVYKQPTRTADVVAVADAKLLNFSFEDYNRLIKGMPEIGRKLRNNLGRVAASRAWTMQSDETQSMRQRSGTGPLN